MYSARYADTIALRLEAGEDVHTTLLDTCRQYDVEGAFVVSGIGMLADPELGYFIEKGRYERRTFPGRFELLNLSGNISLHNDELMAHLHALLANTDYSVFGGHLFNATVGLTLEAQITVVSQPIRMHRKLEQDSGLPGLLIE